MNALVPFDSAKVPAHIKSKKVANAFATLVRQGFKVLSIKSKVFTIVDGESKTLVTKPDDDDTPASNLEVVIVDVNPNKSRVYYKGGYEEGSANKPTCYSNDNITPAADASDPQSKKCATCPHAQYGSKITESGKKSFACTESMRLAVAPAGQVNDPMLLRVPASSLKALGAFGQTIALKGAEPWNVVTKLGFDYTVSHPALTFKPVGWVTDEMQAEIDEVRKTETVGFITGVVAMPSREEDDEPFVAPPKPEVSRQVIADQKAENADKAARRKPAVQDDDDLPTTKKAKVAVEEDAPKAKAAPVVDDSTDDLEFDD